MGKLVDGDDGLPVEEVGPWAEDKIESLRRYIDISRSARAKWIAPGRSGATYIDLFCGPGRSKVRRSSEFIEGGCVAAWKESVRGGAPFSKMYIADLDDERRNLAAERLRRLNAPVVELHGGAATAAFTVRAAAPSSALHFAFLDPYNLAAFDFSIVHALANFQSIDILVHISKMDLQRNTGLNIAKERSAFDAFAPGWRSHVDTTQRHPAIRRDVFAYWQKTVADLGVFPSTDMQLITGSKGQHLYWLTLCARHDLAHKFWKVAANKSGQGSLF